MAILGIVEAALSTELKGKIARKLGGKSLLEWIVRRVSESARLEGVVVVSCDAESDVLAELVPPDVAFYASDGRDVLANYARVLQPQTAGTTPDVSIDAVVRVCADTPFIDPVLIDRLVRTVDDHPGCDYISYTLGGGQPAIFSPLGIFAEWCRASPLLQANDEAASPSDRRLPTRFVYSHPERFRVRLIPVPAGLDRADLRLTILSEEDWEHTQAIYEALGSEGLDWQRVAELLDHQPALRERMAVLNQGADAGRGH